MTIKPTPRPFVQALLVAAIATFGCGCADEETDEATDESPFIIGDAAQCEAVEDRLLVQEPLVGNALDICGDEPQGTPVFDPESGTVICSGSLYAGIPVASSTDQSPFFAQYVAYFLMPPSPGEERFSVAVGLHPIGAQWGTGCSSQGSFRESPSGSKVASSLAGLELCVDDDRIVLDESGNTDNLYVKQGEVYCPVPLREL